MEDSVTAPDAEGDGLLTVADLCRRFEEAEDATLDARKQSERDRDYTDNKQLTAAELKELAKRGQPPTIDNRIKTKVDYLVGLEKQQRIDPKALPRTPKHENDADGATQALRYVSEQQDFDSKRSGVWRNMLVEGAGGISVAVETGYDGEPQIVLRRIAWDRMFFDPHSSETDFSDAGYLGVVLWMDYDDALKMYPDEKDALDATMLTAPSDTYDDKPKFNHWADKKRKRVRICQIWVKREEKWHFAEFTKGGILKAGPSPYVDDKGEPDCELFFQSAYVDRDNNRYGLVREMISLQDEINKRRSKSLHLLNVAQTWIESDALPSEMSVEQLRKEAAKPDGTILLNPGAMSNNKVKIETRTDLAKSHFELLQEAKNAIDLKGPNATEMGDKAQGSSSASGKAIIASQQGGMVQIGDLMDNLRHLDKRVFRAIWNRIRQYWTAEKWVRVTDDERNVKWVGMNVDPQQMQMAMQANPEMQEKIAGVVGSVAELDCDIIIDEAPDSVTPQLEQWQGLVELAKGGVAIPPDVLVEAAPNLKNKDRLLERMKEAQQNQGASPEIAKAQAELKIAQEKAASDAALKKQQQETDAALQAQKNQQEIELARTKAAAEIELKREMAAADIEIKGHQAAKDAELKDHQARADQDHQERKFKFESNMKRRQEGETVDDNAELVLESPLAKALSENAKALTHIAELTAAAHKAASAPRRTQIVRDKNGRPVEAVSMIHEAG